MTELVSTTPGLYPLPDWAKRDLEELKGHQKHDLIDGSEGEEIRAVYESAREEVVTQQLDAGLDLVVEGQLRWDDMLAHPLAVADAVDTRGIVRYYDNNNFYREPVVTGDLEASGDVGAELEAAAEILESTDASAGLAAILPGPYTLADLATDEHYGDEAAFLDAVGEFLAEEVELFPDVEFLTLLEPSLVESAPGDGVDERASRAIDDVATAIDAEVAVQPVYGALEERVYAHLLDADIDAVGFDLVSDHNANAYNAQEYGATDDVLLGIVDGRNTLVESPETIRERVEWFQEQTPAADYGRIYATANTDLFFLPTNRFGEKLQALAGATAATEVEA
jgi:5-methyltetrahydropteroyltriglutamate--homocysteine methyltransferase